ncbi:hypothetical protein [Lancefieldella rimae]|uniref:hypothetical protein n=1 Tax=Lancefieldella rimae TaxID=1383 RepID=UPI002880681D|nr:hypothetical protein [Lancefieldella rimae]
MDVIVHKRITERHPELTEQDVLDAWENAIYTAPRKHAQYPFEMLVLGFDSNSRPIEMLVAAQENAWVIYHAMTPPTKKFLSAIKRAPRKEI